MHKIVIIKKVVKQNQKNLAKITKKGYNNKHQIATEIFLKKKKT